MKIKKKVEMNLHELIKWAWENDIKSNVFYGSLGGRVEFNSHTHLFTLGVESTETFTIEVEEEITERMVIPLLLEVYEYDERLHMHLNKNLSIKAVLDESLDDLLYVPRSFHILNDDMTMTLIWKDGELVE
ncbi:hypothetical protein [Staphylococcus delphini]|uniref:hypothetical protein n=1 Tax=Staphylococcus delphini TaxID=53344 RepID=UPI000BBCBF10|nr:hypothetical protein [Staphylococcus delphini]PCF45061.1 hypothetical protein B5B98_09350 [Staphylococcus delphini]PCF72827.1 hypothetical protein B4W71_08370 [Staphylococcus delphini]